MKNTTTMKAIIYFFILFLFSFKLFSQEYKESELPAEVLSSFNDKFTHEGNVVWFKDADIFTASFTSEYQNLKVGLTSEGKWIDTKYEIASKELPAQILSYINSKFKDAKIKESSLRESATESDHYYIILEKEEITSVAELFFDVKGNFIKKNVPADFYKSSGNDHTTVTVPSDILAAFKTRLPDAIISNWKAEGLLYTAYFVNDEMNGRAEFTSGGIWNFTKYTFSEKELPGPAMSHYKSNYTGYKIKTSELVQEPAVTDYYYVYAKKDGIGQPRVELCYSLTGKFIKQLTSEDINDDINTDVSENISDTTAGKIENTTESISIKELPSQVITYIKEAYNGYTIKEAIMSTSDKGTFYCVKIKKEGKKEITELSFDMNGKFLEKKGGEEEE
ncbi:MAG: PepSY-like domain-containing protein [Bacteroidota bacterium]